MVESKQNGRWIEKKRFRETTVHACSSLCQLYNNYGKKTFYGSTTGHRAALLLLLLGIQGTRTRKATGRYHG